MLTDEHEAIVTGARGPEFVSRREGLWLALHLGRPFHQIFKAWFLLQIALIPVYSDSRSFILKYCTVTTCRHMLNFGVERRVGAGALQIRLAAMVQGSLHRQSNA